MTAETHPIYCDAKNLYRGKKREELEGLQFVVTELEQGYLRGRRRG